MMIGFFLHHCNKLGFLICILLCTTCSQRNNKNWIPLDKYNSVLASGAHLILVCVANETDINQKFELVTTNERWRHFLIDRIQLFDSADDYVNYMYSSVGSCTKIPQDSYEQLKDLPQTFQLSQQGSTMDEKIISHVQEILSELTEEGECKKISIQRSNNEKFWFSLMREFLKRRYHIRQNCVSGQWSVCSVPEWWHTSSYQSYCSAQGNC